jgi:hypothetical protein
VSREIPYVRHHSLFVPRDFDVSPYFQVIKPTLANNLISTARCAGIDRELDMVRADRRHEKQQPPHS